MFDESAVTGRMSEIEVNSDEVDCYRKEVSFFKARTLGTLPTKVTFRSPLILQIINYIRLLRMVISIVVAISSLFSRVSHVTLQTVRVWR